MKKISKLSVIGSGQIGTSVALKAALCHSDMEIVCYDNKDASRDFYKKLQEYKIPRERIKFTTNPADVQGSNLMVLATPVDEMGNAIEAVASYIDEDTVVTDVGSVKAALIKSVRVALDRFVGKTIQYVPFHLLNGTSGVGAKTARPDILDAPGIIVPGGASEEAYEVVDGFFRSLGVTNYRMTAEKHDKILGTMSHLQHAIVFALMHTNVVGDILEERCLMDHGNWISSVTRIAQFDPAVWSAIFIYNKKQIKETAHMFKEMLLDWLERLDDSVEITSSRLSALQKYAFDKAGDKVVKFNHDEIFPDDATNLRALIGLLSIASAANAGRVEKETGHILTPIANPSFKDGISPIAVDPKSVRLSLVWAGTPMMRVMVATDFVPKLNELLRAIDREDKSYIENYIRSSKERHDQLSMAFIAPEVPQSMSGVTRKGLEHG